MGNIVLDATEDLINEEIHSQLQQDGGKEDVQDTPSSVLLTYEPSASGLLGPGEVKS